MKQVYRIIKNKTKQAKGNKNTRNLQLQIKINTSVNTYMKPKPPILKGMLPYDSIKKKKNNHSNILGLFSTQISSTLPHN